MDECKIGFIGLRIVGLPLCKHLVDAGHKVRGYDIVPERVESAVASGGEIGHCCRDVASRSDVVISMLPDSPDMRDLPG